MPFAKYIKSLKIKVVSSVYIISNLVFILLLLMILIVLLFFHRKQEQIEQKQFISFKLSEELLQSSDNLTRMARTYVVTGDSIYKKYYSAILDIRNGQIPRPQNYSNTYWYLGENNSTENPVFIPASGEKISLQQLMINAGIKPNELELLKAAETNSNELVKLELKAFAAVEGWFEDANGNFTIQGNPNFKLAREIMFGKQYEHEKAKIMQPILKFQTKVETRTKTESSENLKRSFRWVLFSIIISALGLFSLLRLAFFMRNIVIKPIDQLTNHVAYFASGDYTKRVNIDSQNELHVLGETYNQLFDQIEQRTNELSASNKVLSHKIEELKQTEIQLIKAKDEAIKANNAKSEFLSRMSHELRTPLNAILGFAQLLDFTIENEKQKKNVTHILKAGKHLLNLINEVLEITKIDAGKLELNIESIDSSVQIDEILPILEPLALENNISVDHQKLANHDSCILADKQRFKQIIMNLVSNAIKYNQPNGKVTIAEELVYINKYEEYFRITVSDTGIGIAESDLKLLFTPFQRIDNDKIRTEGAGLGLSIVKKFVEAMHGQFGVDSQPGVGSTFWVAFPRC